MLADLTIFAASYLIFVDAVVAVVVLAYLLYRRPLEPVLRWAIALIIALVLGYLAARLGGHLYKDPRPFTQDHVKPLISHAPDNGFPSDHALLAAVIVAAFLLVDPLWSIPFIVLGFLVDWARVGAGIHHVSDVVGSSIIIAITTLIGYLVAPYVVRWIMPAFDRSALGQRWGQRVSR
jgi:undecaprenyl-diphosphatase